MDRFMVATLLLHVASAHWTLRIEPNDISNGGTDDDIEVTTSAGETFVFTTDRTTTKNIVLTQPANTVTLRATGSDALAVKKVSLDGVVLGEDFWLDLPCDGSYSSTCSNSVTYSITTPEWTLRIDPDDVSNGETTDDIQVTTSSGETFSFPMPDKTTPKYIVLTQPADSVTIAASGGDGLAVKKVSFNGVTLDENFWLDTPCQEEYTATSYQECKTSVTYSITGYATSMAPSFNPTPTPSDGHVVCEGYSFAENTYCDCDGDCEAQKDTWCGCEEAQACCNAADMTELTDCDPLLTATDTISEIYNETICLCEEYRAVGHHVGEGFLLDDREPLTDTLQDYVELLAEAENRDGVVQGAEFLIQWNRRFKFTYQLAHNHDHNLGNAKRIWRKTCRSILVMKDRMVELAERFD